MPMKRCLCLRKRTFAYQTYAYVYEKVPMSKRKYNFAYQKVPLLIGKNLCLWKSTYAHEKVHMPMKKYLCIWESTYAYKKVHIPTSINKSKQITCTYIFTKGERNYLAERMRS